MEKENRLVVVVGNNEPIKSAITEVLRAGIDAADGGIVIVDNARPEPMEIAFELLSIEIPELSEIIADKPPRRSGQKRNRWR